jgi:hypothetical protein
VVSNILYHAFTKYLEEFCPMIKTELFLNRDFLDFHGVKKANGAHSVLFTPPILTHTES